jgi:hypothetical protein
MESVIVFNAIHLKVPRDQIYRRLGYREHTTRIDPQGKAAIDRYIEYALSFVVLQGAAIRIALAERSDDRIRLITGETFISRNLAAYVGNCTEVLIMGATAGNGIMEAIRRDVDSHNLTRGTVLDAVGSEMADGALDWIGDYFSRQLRRENKSISRNRFSAGYGDWGLENQDTLYRMLTLETIGIEITESHMLVPEKSVTAIARVMPL